MPATSQSVQILTLQNARSREELAALLAAAKALRSQPLEVNFAQVTTITTPLLQMLLAIVQEWQRLARPVAFSAVAPETYDCFTALGAADLNPLFRSTP